MWTRAAIEARLAAHAASDPPNLLVKDRAAVAAVLRFTNPSPEVLLMQRTVREGDRWSGHVSFPGGRAEPADPDLLATAVRETHEEVGLDLVENATLLGRLDAVQAVARGRPLPMTITPFVFALEREPPLVLNEEAEAVFWMPLDLVSQGAFDATHLWTAGPVRLPFPAWKFEGRTVWGLTYQMLSSFLSLLREERPELQKPRR